MTREDCESVAPAILVEAPTPGDPIRSPVRVRGTANTFEAQFILKIVDPGGKTLVEKPVMATSGSGTRGTFDVTVPYKSSKSGWGKIVVYEASAKDGSPINVVEIPVKMR